MFKTLGAIGSHGSDRSVRFGVPHDGTVTPALATLEPSVLAGELAALRNRVDLLAARFRDRYRDDPEVIERTEQVSAAIQRLEWALSRRQGAAMCAGSGVR